MIHSLYNLTRKGWLKALSFILGCTMFGMILLKSAIFASVFGGYIPYLAIFVFYAMAVLWIHGIGFEIKQPVWQMIFLPLIGYIIIIPSLIFLIRQ